MRYRMHGVVEIIHGNEGDVMNYSEKTIAGMFHKRAER